MYEQHKLCSTKVYQTYSGEVDKIGLFLAYLKNLICVASLLKTMRLEASGTLRNLH